MHGTGVRGAANDPARSLHDLAQTRIEVGVFITRTKGFGHSAPHFLIDRVDLWQAERSDKGADEPATDQVDALAKRTAQYCKANALAAGLEPP